jgi:plastocyanin
MTGRLRTAAAVTLTALLTFSCFSDRPGALAPISEEDCRIPGSAVGPDRAVVLIRGFAFLPDTLRIRPGTTVTWVNCEAPDVEAHTSTSDSGLWDSGTIAPGESFERTFSVADTLSYFCRPHPFMRGTVLVES